MKATSKLISVVLILALCLSMFTISAFAAGPLVIQGGSVEDSKLVTGNAYTGNGYGQADPDQVEAQNETQNATQDNEPETSETAEAVSVADGFVEVATDADLQAALEAKSANIRLTAPIKWAGVLTLDYDVTIDLGGQGKGLTFTGSGDAAVFSSAKAVLFNGNLFVNGDVLATEDQEAVAGFKTVAASSEEGSVYLNGVYVQYTDEGSNAIFGEGVSLGSGVFSQDVSAYYGEEAAAQYVFETKENGMFDVTAKQAVEEADNTGDEADSEKTEEEPANQVNTLEGKDEANGIYVTVSGVNLPKDYTVTVKPMDNSMLQAGENQEVLFVVDITIYDTEGNVYEPAEDPNVPEVTVQIRHPALGNVEEGEAVTLYHIVKGTAVPVTEPEEVAGQDAMEFSTDSFSPYGAIVNKTTGSTGDVHYRVVMLDSKEIVVNGNDVEIQFSGNMMPEALSILPYELAGSGDYATYKSYLLDYDASAPTDRAKSDYEFDSTTKPTKVTIHKEALVSAPDGKFGVVFWFKDQDTRVYMVQPVIIVNKDAVEGVGDNFTPTTFGDNSKGTFDVEMCDANSVKVKLSDELKEFTISNAQFGSVTIDATAKKVTIDGKTYHASELYSVEDYHAEDPVSHDFVAGKMLTLTQTMMKLIGFRDGVKLTVTQKNGKIGDFTLNITPGITVADGLDDYIKGKNLWVKFQACAPIDYDSDGTLAIWIGGQKISHEYYSISNDHKTLWIYRNLLDQLKSNNRYTLKARLWQFVKDPVTGEKVKETYYPATASFNVLAAGSTSSKSPKTGDESNIALWASVLVLSGGAVVALIPKKKKSGVK